MSASVRGSPSSQGDWGWWCIPSRIAAIVSAWVVVIARGRCCLAIRPRNFHLLNTRFRHHTGLRWGEHAIAIHAHLIGAIHRRRRRSYCSTLSSLAESPVVQGSPSLHAPSASVCSQPPPGDRCRACRGFHRRRLSCSVNAGTSTHASLVVHAFIVTLNLVCREDAAEFFVASIIGTDFIVTGQDFLHWCMHPPTESPMVQVSPSSQGMLFGV